MSDFKEVVLVPSQLLTASMWAAQVAALSHIAHFSVARHGEDATISGMADRLLLDAPDRFHLVVQGMGGFVSFEVMRQSPERVLSLVLIGTVASADGPAQTERRQTYSRLVESGQFSRVIEERIPLLLHPGSASDAGLLFTLRTMAEETGAETFLRQQDAIISRADSRDSIREIKCPALIVRGSHDGITSDAYFEELCRLIPGARGCTIDASGHLPTLEQPAQMTALLQDWLLR